MDETPVYFDTPREEDDMHEVDCTVCEGTFSSQRTLEIHTEMEHPNYLKIQSCVSRKPQKDEVKETEERKEGVYFPLPKGPRKNIKGRGQTIAEVIKDRHAYKDLAEQLSFVSLPIPRSKSGFVECPRFHTSLAGHLNRHLKTCNGIPSPQSKKSLETHKQKSVKPSPKVVKPSPKVVKTTPKVVKPSQKVVKPSPKVVKPSPKLPRPLVKNSPKVSQTVVHTRHNSRYSEEQMLSAIQAVVAGTMAKAVAARTYDVPRSSLKEATDRYIKAQKSDSDMDDEPVLFTEADPKECPEKGLKKDSKANLEEESEKGLKKDSYVHLKADAKEDLDVQVPLTTATKLITPTKLSALGLKRQPKVDERVEELKNSDFSPYNSDDTKRKKGVGRPRGKRKSTKAPSQAKEKVYRNYTSKEFTEAVGMIKSKELTIKEASDSYKIPYSTLQLETHQGSGWKDRRTKHFRSELKANEDRYTTNRRAPALGGYKNYTAEKFQEALDRIVSGELNIREASSSYKISYFMLQSKSLEGRKVNGTQRPGQTPRYKPMSMKNKVRLQSAIDKVQSKEMRLKEAAKEFDIPYPTICAAVRKIQRKWEHEYTKDDLYKAVEKVTSKELTLNEAALLYHIPYPSLCSAHRKVHHKPKKQYSDSDFQKAMEKVLSKELTLKQAAAEFNVPYPTINLAVRRSKTDLGNNCKIKKLYSDEDFQKALNEITSNGLPIKQASEKFGIPISTLTLAVRKLR